MWMSGVNRKSALDKNKKKVENGITYGDFLIIRIKYQLGWDFQYKSFDP